MGLANILPKISPMTLTQATKWLGIAILLGFGQAFAQTLPISLAKKLMEAGINESNASFLAVSLDDGKPIISHLANTPRTPASTQKLITTAVALDTLGADFSWHTDVYHTGIVANKVLYGDVIIVGSGDPSMDYQRLNALLGQLAGKVKHIQGNIYLDDHKFAKVNYDPYAFDGQGLRAYNAAPSAFLLNFGTVEFRFVPSGWQDEFGHFVANPNATHASLQLFPKLDGFMPLHQIPTKQGCELPNISLNKNEQSIQINGAFGIDCGTQSLWQTFGDNQILAKKAVLATWRHYDNQFVGQVLMGRPATSPHLLPLASSLSAPVAKQIWQINQFSNNVMTEQVALSLPLYAGGQAVSDYPSAFLFLNNWWQKKIDKNPPTITRASGLCTDCQIRPSAMVDLLTFMYRHQNFAIYKQSLPVAGLSGTMASLSKRNENHPAIGRAWIKTGRLNDVAAIAGYVESQTGHHYAVVAIINAPKAGSNTKATAVLDEFLAQVANY